MDAGTSAIMVDDTDSDIIWPDLIDLPDAWPSGESSSDREDAECPAVELVSVGAPRPATPTVPRRDIIDWILGANPPTAALQFRGTSAELEAFFVDDEGFIVYLRRGRRACMLEYCPTAGELSAVIGRGMAILPSGAAPPISCCVLL
jgi:hypothetical protein